MKTFLKIFAFAWLLIATMLETAVQFLAPGTTWVKSAITQNPLIGRMRKTLGNVIAYTSFGQNILRSKPLEVNDANSTAQQAQRGFFADVQVFCRRALNALHIGFVNYASNMSPYSFAIGQNLLLAPNSSTPPDAIDLSKAIISKGNLLGFQAPEFAAIAGREITLQWSDNSGSENADMNDNVGIFAIRTGLDAHVSDLTGTIKRQSESGSIVCSNMTAGEKVRVYAFLYSADGTLVSDSIVSAEMTLLADS